MDIVTNRTYTLNSLDTVRLKVARGGKCVFRRCHWLLRSTLDEAEEDDVRWMLKVWDIKLIELEGAGGRGEPTGWAEDGGDGGEWWCWWGVRRGVWLRHREACWRKPRLRRGDSSNVPITPDTFTRSRQIKGIYSAPAWRHSEGFIHSFCKILLLLETNRWVQRSPTARSLQFSAGQKVRRLASRLAILRLETRVARC